MSTDERCGNCKFYRHQWQCLRHAPITSPERDRPGWTGIYEPIWPQVRESYWCGDYERRSLQDER